MAEKITTPLFFGKHYEKDYHYEKNFMVMRSNAARKITVMKHFEHPMEKAFLIYYGCELWAVWLITIIIPNRWEYCNQFDKSFAMKLHNYSQRITLE